MPALEPLPQIKLRDDPNQDAIWKRWLSRLQSNVSTLGGFASGSVPFAASDGTLTSDTNFTYNSTTDVLTVNGSTFGLNSQIGGTLGVTGAATLSSTLTYGGVTLTAAVTGTGSMVLSTSPTLVTPALGTPSALVGTNITGTAAGLTAGNVTTNANLTGPITSVGNATSVAAQTGTGSTFVMQASPTLTTPNIGVATGTSLQAIIGNVTPAAGSFTTLGCTGNTIFGNATTDTHTFTGDVRVDTTTTTGTYETIRLGNTGAAYIDLAVTQDSVTASNRKFVIEYGNVAWLTCDNSRDATFSGNLTVSGASISITSFG